MSSIVGKISKVLSFGAKSKTEEEELFPILSFSEPLPPDAEPLTSYMLSTGVRVNIGLRRSTGQVLYYVQEPELSDVERRAYQRLMYRLTYELHLEAGKGPEAYTPEALAVDVENAARDVSARYGATSIHELTQEKLMYYVKRDLVGYGAVDALLDDNDIEDVKVSSYDEPFILIHREFAQYGWLMTNIKLDHDMQDRLARRLALMGRSSLSTAFPTVECMLPTGDRLSAFYQYEVSPYGTSITIRRHKREPYTLIQLVEHGELSTLMVACLWQLLEAKGVIFVVGQPGTGKTALVNAMGIMIPDTLVPVTIEDFPELNLPQQFKQSLVTRYSKSLRTEAVKRGEQVGEINQEDLLRNSLRIRPDYLIVGEILTKEAPVFLQAINIGLSGLTSFHADSIETAVARLTEKTIGVEPAMLRLIDWVIAVGYLKHETSGNMVRRIRTIDEIRSVGDYNSVFKWLPYDDSYEPRTAAEAVEKSASLSRIMLRRGISKETLIAEIEDKQHFIEDLKARGIKKFQEVSDAFRAYNASKTSPTIMISQTETAAAATAPTSQEDALWQALRGSSPAGSEEQPSSGSALEA